MTTIDYNDPYKMWLNNGYDPYKGMSDEERIKEGRMQAVVIIVMLIVGLTLCAMLSGCTTTEYVPVPEYHTDTVRISHNTHDSIYVHDSTYIKEKGDSVYIERWHTKYVLKEKTDTLYESRVDSIPVPYEVVKEVEVEKSLSWWQAMRMHIGGIVVWLLLILAIYGILKWRKWL